MGSLHSISRQLPFLHAELAKTVGSALDGKPVVDIMLGYDLKMGTDIGFRLKRLVISTGNHARSLPWNEFIGGGAVNWGAEKK